MKSLIKTGLGRAITRLEALGRANSQGHRRRQFRLVAEFDESVTFGDGAELWNDTGDKAAITIGPACGVFGTLRIFPQGGRIAMGQKCFIGPGARLWARAQITLGDYVLIAHDVNIHDNISHSLSWRERRQEIDSILPNWISQPHDFDLQAKPIIIEDDAWIGYGASILGGVRIGRGAVIGAGTVVTADVAQFSVVVGNPMRVVKLLDGSDARN